MKNLEHKHIIAVLRSKAFNFSIDHFDNEDINHKMNHKQWNKITDREFDEIHDGIYDFFIESAPVVYERVGRGDFGSFPIRISGVRGAYFSWAPEFGYEGPFDTKAEAIQKSYYYYG